MNAKSKVRILQYENYILITVILYYISNILNAIVNVTKNGRKLECENSAIFSISVYFNKAII